MLVELTNSIAVMIHVRPGSDPADEKCPIGRGRCTTNRVPVYRPNFNFRGVNGTPAGVTQDTGPRTCVRLLGKRDYKQH